MRGHQATSVCAAVPRNTPPNTTLIAALSLAGMGPALTLRGATDTATFEV